MENVALPPAELGILIAHALVGTFLGILLAYGFVGPLAKVLEIKANEAGKVYLTIKTILLASLNGYAPQVAVEFGRKAMDGVDRPSFKELEEHVKSAKGK
jgi:chemotaxis protein MotA